MINESPMADRHRNYIGQFGCRMDQHENYSRRLGQNQRSFADTAILLQQLFYCQRGVNIGLRTFGSPPFRELVWLHGFSC